MADSVDLTIVRESMQAAWEQLEQIDGYAYPVRMPGKSRAAELANIAKNLLYLGHLLRRAETAVLDEYYISRGWDAGGRPSTAKLEKLDLVAAADQVAQIPIANHSLNAAMAATVALYELTRVPTA